MDWFAKAFIRASLLWFVAGITLGLAMAIHPAWVVYRPAHAHMNLLVAGFMLAPHVGARSVPVTASGGALWALGAYGFVYNLWRTFNAAERRRRLDEQRPAGRQLPTAEQ